MNPEQPIIPADKDMIKRIMDGDRHAAASLIRSTEKLVAGIVYKMIADHWERKDLVQDVYLKVFRYLPGFRFQSKLSTWVAQISYTTCLDHLEKNRPELLRMPDDLHENAPPGISKDVLDASQLLSIKERSAILEKISSTLPPVYRTLITLFHKEELSIDEIVHITGLPAGTVKNYLFRARKVLKERLLDHYSKKDL